MSHLCSSVSFLFKGIRGYKSFMKLKTNTFLCQEHPEIEQKLQIIKFFDKYGLSPTKDAFKTSRSSIYLWKKKLNDASGSLHSLINESRKPKRSKKMYIEIKTYEFIESLRRKYPTLSKDKIKPLLDEFCRENNLPVISPSTIGKIIKRNNWFFYLHNRRKPKSKQNKRRVFGYKVKDIGDLVQLDAIVKFEQGIKRYVITAIETKSKFGFGYSYTNLSSKSAADFIEKLTKVSPFQIKAIQTDNGSEFLRLADQKMQDKGIVHFFTYPRSPKSNAVIERFNRTIQDEFINGCEQTLFTDTNQFNHELMDYLLFYNTKRIHSRISGKVPMNYILEKSNMYATDASIFYLF